MPRRILEGNIVSDKMDKTVTVLVERRFIHPVYKKYVRRTDKYAAHDEQNSYKTGDRVLIEECSPISKRKTWRVVSTAAGEVKEGAAVMATEATAAKKPDVKKPAAKKPAKK